MTDFCQISGKEIFDTRADADERSAQMRRRLTGNVRELVAVYRCDEGHWHVGHTTHARPESRKRGPGRKFRGGR